MTRPAALTLSLTTVALLALATVHLFADPFGLHRFWSEVRAQKLPYQDPVYLQERAQFYYSNGDRALAHDISQRILMITPNNKEAYKLLAAIYLKDKNYRKAEEAARAATRIDPTDGYAQLAVGESLQGQGLEDAAIQAYRAVIASKTTDARQREIAVEKLDRIKPSLSRTTESQRLEKPHP
jgi:tetratricopeptide (TPR) repeat protein